MALEITYNSDEIHELETTLENQEKILGDNMKQSLASNFDSLTAIGFGGINKLQSQTDSLITSHSSFIKELKEHDENKIELENAINTAIKAKLDNNEYEEANDASQTHELNDVVLQEVNEGQEINTEMLTEAVKEFSYTAKAAMLQNILNLDVGSLTSLLTDTNKSNILVYEIRQMLNDETTDLSRAATKGEKEVQKEFIRSLAKETSNIFKEVDENTFLRGIPYYKKISELNGINIEDLLLDDKNKKLLTDCVKFVCEHNAVNGIDDSDIAAVKAYVNEVANKHKLSTRELLTSSNAQLLKEGV